jgi:leucyl aminopeptidase (aminopeptidase T)
MGSLEEGASNAVKICMGVNSSDRVLIVTDHDTKEIADAVYRISSSIADSEMFVLEAYIKRPMNEVPVQIFKAIPRVTVTFWIAQSYEGELKARSIFRTEALKYARHAHMPGVTKTMMEQGMCADYDLVCKTTMKLYELVRNINEMHVTSEEGTNLHLEFNKEWRWIPSHGIFRKMGEWGNLPDGEVFTAPYSANGVIVVSEFGDWFARKYGHLQEKISIRIIDSRIIPDFDCADANLRKDLSQYLSTDENSNRASEFAIPTNLHLMSMPLIGNMLQDEKARVHIAFGDPYGSQTNAGWTSATHVDCILERCNLSGDGMQIMRDDKLLVG